MKVRRSLLKDTVSVETYSGDSAYGAMYADAVSVRCNIDQKRRWVRTAAGDEAVSEMTLYVHPDDSAYFTPETRVTASAYVSRVLAVKPHTFRGYTVHLEVSVA